MEHKRAERIQENLSERKTAGNRMLDMYRKALEARNPKELARTLLRRLMPQILIQFLAVMLTSFGAYILMTFLIVDVAHVQSTYLSAVFEALGTMGLTIIVLITLNTFTYRRRLREITTLSDAITQVSNGDFQYRIPIKNKEPMAVIYEDFNKMTEELSSVQTLRNDFINSFSHEFKTPIASINGFAELLLQKDISEEERRQYLEIIRDESERLSGLTKNTILLSRISAQQIITDVEEYDLAAQLRQCAIVCSNQWMAKNQEFQGDFEDVTYLGNKELMAHLWLNLLGNAIKYTPEGGAISMSLQKAGNRAVVCVKDNGIGMSRETREHLFDPYYQGDTSHADQGMGLGMSIVKRILELCNATITVQSEIGQGTEIKVELPL